MITKEKETTKDCYSVADVYNWLFFAHKQGLTIDILLQILDYDGGIPKIVSDQPESN